MKPINSSKLHLFSFSFLSDPTMNSIWSLIKQNRERQEEENKTKDRTPVCTSNENCRFLPLIHRSSSRKTQILTFSLFQQ